MFADVLKKVVKVTENPGDYTEPDGLLYCGRCDRPKQMNTGHDEITVVPVLCECEKQRRERQDQERRAKEFDFRIKAMWEDGITARQILRHNFSDDDGAQAKISAACRKYVERWNEMQADNIGVLFYGNIGSGKSFFASCIGNGLLEKQVTVAATNFPRLLNLLQGTQERQKLLDRLSSYRLLVLDDLGCERDSSFGLEQVYNIIDARASSQLPVIVTTNLTLEELEHPASMQYARIYDRVLEMCPVRFKMIGESRRAGNAERRKQKARELLL